MSRVFTEDFGGAAAPTAITDLNSAYTNVQITTPANGSALFDAANGPAALVQTNATGTSVQLQQNLAAAVGRRYRRFYLELAADNAVDRFISQVRDATAVKAQLRLNVNRTLSLRNGFAAVATTTTAVPLGGRHRIEWQVDSATTVQRLRLYVGTNLNGGTPTEEISGLYNKGTFDTVDDGLITSVANTEMRISNVADDDAAWVGSAVAAAAARTHYRRTDTGTWQACNVKILP